jgi:hypothetical protein
MPNLPTCQINWTTKLPVIWDDTAKNDSSVYQYTCRHILHKNEVCIEPLWDLHISYRKLVGVATLQRFRGFEKLRNKKFFSDYPEDVRSSLPRNVGNYIPVQCIHGPGDWDVPQLCANLNFCVVEYFGGFLNSVSLRHIFWLTQIVLTPDVLN